MRRAWIALAAALGVILTLVPVAQAIKIVTPVLKLEAANGYRGAVSGGGRQVNINVETGGIGGSYTTRGETGRRLIRADFGPFGHVDTTFTPSGDPVIRRLPGPCEGTIKIRRGTWAGAVEFTAEGGFTSASIQSASGKVIVDRFHCRPDLPRRVERETASDGSNATSLDAGGKGVSFNALRLDRSQGSTFFASRDHRVGRVFVSEYAQARGQRGDFSFDLERRRASVSPPAPFTGSARYRRAAGHTLWRGDLAVALPNATAPLTGPGFHAALRRVTALVTF